MPGDEAPRLLLREQAELDGVAAKLRAGRRVVVFCVCAEALRPAALSFLRARSGVAIPYPAPLRSAEEALERLTALTEQPPGVVASLAIDAGAVEVLRTLNWHREKLRRGGSAIVWLEDAEGLRALRAWAPDAYAFRDALLLLLGEPHVELLTPAEDTLDVAIARSALQRARTPEERAEAAWQLALSLRNRGALDEVRRVAEEALEQIPTGTYRREWAKLTRAGLYMTLATIDQERGQLAQAWRWTELGLGETAGLDSSEGRLRRVFIMALKFTPLGVDHKAAAQALIELSLTAAQAPLERSMFTLALGRAAESARLRGDLPRASKILRRAIQTPGISSFNSGVQCERQARVSLDAGELSTAEEQLRMASSLYLETSTSTVIPTFWLARCFRDRSEMHAAKCLLDGLLAYPGRERPIQAAAAIVRAEIRLGEGSVVEALAELQALVMEAARGGYDEHLHDASTSLVGAARRAHDANRSLEADLQAAYATVAMAQDTVLSIAGDDPPWYSILFPALRGELLALQPDHLDEALGLLATALERARAAWTDAAPLHARKLIHHLVRAGRLEEARAALATSLPEAEAQENLKELAALQASNVIILARTGAASAEVTSALDRLRATFEANGGRLLPAETLLELARALPPDARHPDPLQLLDEAHALFLEMPMPAQEARCLEAMGDVLAARGQTSDARRRYLLAKGIYEQYGLGLRLPLLASKLSRLPPPQAS